MRLCHAHFARWNSQQTSLTVETDGDSVDLALGRRDIRGRQVGRKPHEGSTFVGGVIEGHVGQRANCGSGRRPWARRPEKRRSTGACANRREFVQKIADYRVGVGSRLSRILVEGGPPVGQSPLEIIKDHEDIELSLRVVQMINQG